MAGSLSSAAISILCLLLLQLYASPAAAALNYTSFLSVSSASSSTSSRSPFSRSLEEFSFGPLPPSSDTVNACSCFSSSSVPRFKAAPDHTINFELISFNVNGAGHSRSNIALAHPGDSVTLLVSGKANDDNTECSGCVAQIYVRGHESLNLKMCLGSAVGDFTFTNEATLTAPSVPGVYHFTTDWSWEYSCNYVYRGSSKAVIATLHVAAPEKVHPPGAEEMNEECNFEYVEQFGDYKPEDVPIDGIGEICSPMCAYGYFKEDGFEGYGVESFAWTTSTTLFCYLILILILCFCNRHTNAQTSALVCRIGFTLNCLGGFAYATWALATPNKCGVMVGLLITPLVLALSISCTGVVIMMLKNERGAGNGVRPNSDSIRNYSKPLASLRDEEKEENHECSICMDGFSAEDLEKGTARELHNCGHVFHEVCLINWVQGQHGYGATRTCPNCRVKVDVKGKKNAKRARQMPVPVGNEDIEITVVGGSLSTRADS